MPPGRAAKILLITECSASSLAKSLRRQHCNIGTDMPEFWWICLTRHLSQPMFSWISLTCRAERPAYFCWHSLSPTFSWICLHAPPLRADVLVDLLSAPPLKRLRRCKMTLREDCGKTTAPQQLRNSESRPAAACSSARCKSESRVPCNNTLQQRKVKR